MMGLRPSLDYFQLDVHADHDLSLVCRHDPHALDVPPNVITLVDQPAIDDAHQHSRLIRVLSVTDLGH